MTIDTAALTAAATRLADLAEEMLTDSPLVYFQCSEAEAIAAVVRATGRGDLAEQLIDAHAECDDDPADRHHHAYLAHLAQAQADYTGHEGNPRTQ